MALFKKKKSPLTSSRLVERKRRMRTAKIIFYILFFVLAVYGAVWFSGRPEFQITTIEIYGNTSLTASDLQAIAQAKISGSYIFIFPRANKFLYPQSTIKNELLSKFPEIASIQVFVKGQALSINVVERSPQYMWCKSEPSAKSSDCYFMDKDGYIFSSAPNFSSDVYFTYYGMISADNPIRLTYLDANQFGILKQIQRGLEDAGISTFAENSSADGVREFYLNSGGKIIFKSTQDPASLVSAIGLVKSQTSVFSKSSAPIDYVDMRFGNKVYYKFVGDNAVQSPR